MENPRTIISIITPCYNASKFIEECIESALAQEYPFIEHIIQDGASTDGTIEIIKRYADKYPDKISFLSEPDKGQSDGLNRAIQRSRGDILLVLNADDALMPKACSWAIENMTKYPGAAVIYGDVYVIDENSVFQEDYVSQPYNFEKLLCLELVPPAQSSFIRRSHFEKVGFYADQDLDTCPDYEMWVRIGLVFPFQKVSGYVSKYRKHFQATDSKDQRTAKRFFDSKKLVMDRVFNSPRTPPAIRNLRTRAYSGLVVWTAIADLGLENNKRAVFLHYLLNLRYYSGLTQVELRYLFRNVWLSGISYTKRFVRRSMKAFLILLPKKNLIWLEKTPGSQKWKKLINECINSQK